MMLIDVYLKGDLQTSVTLIAVAGSRLQFDQAVVDRLTTSYVGKPTSFSGFCRRLAVNSLSP
jgi:hypothetical protein